MGTADLVHPASKSASSASLIGLLLQAVQSLLGLGFKALELGRILAENQQTTKKASQECEDVGHRLKGLGDYPAGDSVEASIKLEHNFIGVICAAEIA